MSLDDLKVFLQERMAVFDENTDVSDGSPFDVQVIEPVLRRLGTDPFTVDVTTFLQTRLLQDFPELATKEGDAITDLLIKTNTLLMDPIVRENFRIKQNQSFLDPTTLTLDEAAALGANLFSTLNTGNKARGTARIYFAQAQNASVSPSNFFTSKTGLRFFPTEVQSISAAEMLLNVEGSLFYFDVTVVAEKAGDEYNIDADDLITIANITSAARVTNKRRFRFGSPAETAEEFVGRAQQELSERSLVTIRGISARITESFPEVSRLAVVGFNDPEMQRDVLRGGGLGPIKAAGTGAVVVADGENKLYSRRINLLGGSVPDPVLTELVGALGSSTGWVITVIGAFGGVAPFVRDLPITRMLSDTLVEVENQVLFQSNSADTHTWTLRKNELTLSQIPGGIIFPDGPNGTVAVIDDQVHIGGTTDIEVRGADFDSTSLLITDITDDTPLRAGVNLDVVDSSGNVSLGDFVLGTNYAEDDDTFEALNNAAVNGWTLVILEGPAAGAYRIIKTTQTLSASPVLQVTPAPFYGPPGTDNLLWKITDEIDIDLAEPKETRIAGNDVKTVQGTNILETTSGIDFSALGVAQDDIVRLFTGPDAGDYTITASPLPPFFDKLQVDRPIGHSVSGIRYAVFRANSSGGLKLPFVRISSIDLLDTSGQPIGSKIPYAKAVDARSRAFANISHGVKVDVRDGRLGIVGQVLTGSPLGANVSGQTLTVQSETMAPVTVVFSGSNPISLANIILQINTAIGRVMAFVVDGDRLGIAPNGPNTRVTGTSLAALFGDTQGRTSRDIRSTTVENMVTNGVNGWPGLSPPVDPLLDVAQVLTGGQVGFYRSPDAATPFVQVPASTALWVDFDFAPEVSVRVQEGSRSIGTARIYFLEPTTVEFGANTVLETTNSDGIDLRFFPDPTNSAQKIPARPSGDKPKDGATTASSSVFTSSGTDFTKKGIRVGDQLVLQYKPITGTAVLSDPVANLATKNLVLSIDGSNDKTITFVNDNAAIPSTSVTRAGVASQINKAAGKTICSIVTVGANNYLEFEADASIAVRKTGTANTILGFSTIADQSNDALDKGTYVITVVGTTTLTVEGSGFLNTETRLMFEVLRPGAQRISSTEMSSNVETAGLYYFDLELVSEGTGDLWNIDAALAMTVDGYMSDGYWLSTDDSNLSFSTAEKPRLHLSPSILEVGVSDDPDNATQLSGQNIQINYDRTTIVSSVESFVSAETERVICSSPLARHLVPHFVRFDLSYVGGSKESVVTPLITSYIQDLAPNDLLEVSDLEKILSDNGATSITNPVDLIAVVHNADRTVTVQRSQNSLNTGRLAAFIPDVLTIKRKVS